MRTTRREFISIAASAGAGLALSGRLLAQAAGAIPGAAPGAAGAGKRVLILGGTGFLGPACIEAALARGHTVTIFNRGRTEDRRKRAGRPSAVPDGVEVLYGNRDPSKTADADNDAERGDAEKDPSSPKGLTQLEGRTWDAVIDTSGHWPRIVGASASLLALSVQQYVHLSSISAYSKTDVPDMDETGATATLADPTTEDFGPEYQNYGGGKAMAEAAAEQAMPGRVTVLRPGYIVGPRDTSRRFLYWPVRASQGGVMLVPGTPADPIQIIDVRDCAEFALRCIEQKAMGVFNVCGPEKPMTMQTMVEGCIKGVGGAATPVWVTPKFLEEQGHEAGFPLWAPPEGETAGFHRVSIAKALKAGLKCRSIEDTAKTTLDWWMSLPAELQKSIVPTVLSPEDEAKIAEAWKSANR